VVKGKGFKIFFENETESLSELYAELISLMFFDVALLAIKDFERLGNFPFRFLEISSRIRKNTELPNPTSPAHRDYEST
jgi:hypothetical protein